MRAIEIFRELQDRFHSGGRESTRGDLSGTDLTRLDLVLQDPPDQNPPHSHAADSNATDSQPTDPADPDRSEPHPAGRVSVDRHSARHELTHPSPEQKNRIVSDSAILDSDGLDSDGLDSDMLDSEMPDSRMFAAEYLNSANSDLTHPELAHLDVPRQEPSPRALRAFPAGDPDHAIPAKGIIPLELLFEDKEDQTAILCDMAEDAQSYLEAFPWCVSIEEGYFGDGIPDVVAAFLFRIEAAQPIIDRWLWVIVGDLPSAYLLTHTSKTPSQALEAYIEEMSKWVALAKEGKFSDKVISVDAPSTPENAEDLEERLVVLAKNVVPAFRKAEAELC
jgi:hypothetical protein